MADIRCSQCGNNNPDFLDLCQFCQAPLHPDAMLHIGEEPTKKDTGELEEVLPDWLKDARRQGKNEEAPDEAFKSQTKPKIPKEEPPDLLAGLMSQAGSDEEEVPDWLASINPVADKKSPVAKSTPAEEPSDFFSQFRESEQKQAPAPVEKEPAQEDVQSWMDRDEEPAGQKDELTDWFTQASSEPNPPVTFDASSEPASDNDSWMKDLASFEAKEEQPPAEKQPEDLSWLHDLEASSKGTSDLPASQSDSGFDFASSSSDDDLGWLNNLGGTPASSFDEPAPSSPSASDDDLSWLNNLGGTPVSSSEESAPSQPADSDDDMSWLNNLGGTPAPSFDEPAPSRPSTSDDDLSWLNNLGDAPASSFEEAIPSQPAGSDEDLSWLNNLGGTPVQSHEEPVPSQSASSDNDLSWLNNLGGAEAPTHEESVPSQSSSSEDDLDWLSNLGGTPISSELPTVKPSSSSGEDLDWLNNLGDTAAPSVEEPASEQPTSSEDELSWLNNLAGTSEPAAPAFADTGQLNNRQEPSDPSRPFQTAPLKELVGDEPRDNTPDWLKSAMEEPSMPAPGAVSMDWFSEHDKQVDQESAQPQGEPASSESAFDFSMGDSSASSPQDVDSLFNVEMPDWLSREPENIETSQPEAIPASEADTLSPVELPSWVQAMRPVDSSIDDATASTVDLITEREGPLAGFRGVIPSSPIGSSLRPKAFSLKLQVTEEQQASASLIEQIIADETLAQPKKAEKGVSSQKILRWILSGLFLIVLSVVLGLGLKTMPIVPSNQLSDVVSTIPDASPVLVVIDYEPSFSGELEASAGPLLDQLALSRRSTFEFVSMSPNGTALADRLLLNTGVSGLGYQAGEQYFNLGFLPGGSTGVLGFIENPADEFSKYEAVILMTDNAETGRMWVEQLGIAKSQQPAIAGKPFIVVSSAQSAPLLQPYVSSGQVDILVNGLSDAAKYEYVNNTRPGIARSYWDAFGVGLTMAVIAMILGSVWSLLMRNRERRAEAEQG